jgi:hypothetical protein
LELRGVSRMTKTFSIERGSARQRFTWPRTAVSKLLTPRRRTYCAPARSDRKIVLTSLWRRSQCSSSLFQCRQVRA